MTAEDLLAALAREVPEVQPVVREHLKDNDELLLHLLTDDLRRFAIEAFDSGRTEVLERLLALLDRAFVHGDNYVTNAIAVSFVEDTGGWDPAMQTFIDSWPPGLKDEARRQKESGPT